MSLRVTGLRAHIGLNERLASRFNLIGVRALVAARASPPVRPPPGLSFNQAAGWRLAVAKDASYMSIS
jgi:hypothetical protein